SSVSGYKSKGRVTVQGFVYAFGSSNVIWISLCSKSRRRKLSGIIDLLHKRSRVEFGILCDRVCRILHVIPGRGHIIIGPLVVLSQFGCSRGIESQCYSRWTT